MKRKVRPGEVVCTCGAYRFPHRMMGGACDGGALMAETFEREMWGSCRSCNNHETIEDPHTGARETVCAVLDGREASHTCEALQAHVSFHGIKLYGVNKLPERRKGGLRFRR